MESSFSVCVASRPCTADKLITFLFIKGHGSGCSASCIKSTRLNSVYIYQIKKKTKSTPVDVWCEDRTPNDTAYKRWSWYSGRKLQCKLCQTFPHPAMGARFTVFGHVGHADPLDGWRCCSQKRMMLRPIQV